MKQSLFIGCLLLAACASPHPTTDNPAVWNKIKIDFKAIDKDGLSGTPTGKVAVHYEFCIPTNEKLWKQVSAIDATAQKQVGRGRVGCKQGTWLVTGSTHQPKYKKVLYDLAALPFVPLIEETFWE